jgi:hypothetical protein
MYKKQKIFFATLPFFKGESMDARSFATEVIVSIVLIKAKNGFQMTVVKYVHGLLSFSWFDWFKQTKILR